MTSKELDDLISELRLRTRLELPEAAEFYNRVLEALGELKEHIRTREIHMKSYNPLLSK